MVQVAGIVASKPATMVDGRRGDRDARRRVAAVRLARRRASSPPPSTGSRSTRRARRCLDAGASTGGFTDALLQRGAADVVAVDVGYGQLAWALRTDDRVTVLERTNVRDLSSADLPYAPDLVVADLSFISLRTVAALARQRSPHDAAPFVVLVKPQFEAGKDAVGSGGVVRDPGVWRRVLGVVVGHGHGRSACVARGAMASPLRGPAGNVEFLLRLSGGEVREIGAKPRRGRRGGTGARGMSNVAFVVHEGRAAAVAAADRLRRTSWSAAGVGVGAPGDDGVDLVVAVGGDGTFLRGAHAAARARRAGGGREGRPARVPHRGRARRRGRARPARRSPATRRSRSGSPWSRSRSTARRSSRSGAERGHGREARPAPAGAAAGRGRRRVRDDVLGRRRDRRDADRFDRVFVLGARPDRLAVCRTLVVTAVAPHMVFDRSIVLDAGPSW